MKRIIIRIENHWRVWRQTRRQMFLLTVFGVTVLNIRWDKGYFGIEVMNLDIMVHRDLGNVELPENTKDTLDTENW